MRRLFIIIALSSFILLGLVPFTTAMFTQPDTLVSNVYDSQGLNRYSFEDNNPIKNTDPTGHDAVIVNYNLNDEPSLIDFQHTSMAVGSDDEGWTAMWYGTSEPQTYSKGWSALTTYSHGQVITGSGSTWQGAIKNMEQTGNIKSHDLSTAVRFSASPQQDSKMKTFITNEKSNQKDPKYAPVGHNCADQVAETLKSGGIYTPKTVIPAVYNRAARTPARINNIVYFIKNLFSSKSKTSNSASSKKVY